MSRGLGKIEKEILRVCSRCYFSKEEILENKPPRRYPGGIRFFHPKTGGYFRGISLGRKQCRMKVEDEEMIDLKEVHYLYRERFAKGAEDMFYEFTGGCKQTEKSWKEIEKAYEEIGPLFGMRSPFVKALSPSQEASYQRGIKSLLRKSYLKYANFGYAPKRFVRINQRKIKPIRPKRYKGNHTT